MKKNQFNGMTAAELNDKVVEVKKELINLIIMIVDRQRLCFVVTEIVFNNLAGAQSDLFSITVIRIPLIGKVIIHGDRII